MKVSNPVEKFNDNYKGFFSISVNAPLYFKEKNSSNFIMDIFIGEEEDYISLKKLGFQFFEVLEEDEIWNYQILLSEHNISLFDKMLKRFGFSILEVKNRHGHFIKNGNETLLIENLLIIPEYKFGQNFSHTKKVESDLGLTVETAYDNVLILNAMSIDTILKDLSKLDNIGLKYFYCDEYEFNFLYCNDKNINILLDYVNSLDEGISYTLSQVKNRVIDDELILEKIRFKFKKGLK